MAKKPAKPDKRPSRWPVPPPAAWRKWEDLLEQGVEPATAARETGFSCSAYRRADSERQKQLLAAAQEARAHFADLKAEEWIEDSDAIRILWLKRWQRAYSEKTHLELTGAEGGPVELNVEDARDRLASRIAGIADRRRADQGAT